MYCVSYYGDIIKAYGEKLKYYTSLGFYVCSNKIEAERYAQAVTRR